MKTLSTVMSLFTSSATLVCCAIPALLVSLGAGAALAGLVSKFPQIVWLSENKIPIFLLGALFLSIGGFLQWKNRHAPCPLVPELAKACSKTRKISLVVYFISLLIYMTGVMFAFVLPKLLN